MQRFDIVVLDEATQVTEPLSLVALIRARAKHVVIAGDPCQLGPILAFPPAVIPNGAQC
jgi:superfamily I DNA and/or RNA helicase